VVPRLSRICAIAVLLLTSGGSVSAIEKFTWIRGADAVVVGKLKLSSFFLWFDGLHVNGTIVATEILYGGHTGPEFEYHLVVPCTLWDASCSLRLQWQHWAESKELILQTEMWALEKGPGASWTSSDPRLAFIYHLTDRERAITILKERKQLEHDHPKP
jgi:hypothetical protein